MKSLSRLLLHLTVFILVLVVLGPLCWMLLASFKTQTQILNPDYLLFFQPTWDNYLEVFSRYNFIGPLVNSALIALFSTLFSLFLGVPAAYAIGKFRMNAMGLAVLTARIIPGLTFLVPWFILFSKMQLVDTLIAMVLTHMLVALPLVVWVILPSFESFPRELEAAALMDGCNTYTTLWRIVLPLTTPAIMTAAILSVIYSWNNFMFALVLAGYNSKTLPVAIFNFIEYAQINWGALMAASVIITLPIVALVLSLQKYVVSGLMSGAVKG